jgi:hypothetical protein
VRLSIRILGSAEIKRMRIYVDIFIYLSLHLSLFCVCHSKT